MHCGVCVLYLPMVATTMEYCVLYTENTTLCWSANDRVPSAMFASLVGQTKTLFSPCCLNLNQATKYTLSTRLAPIQPLMHGYLDTPMWYLLVNLFLECMYILVT